MLTTPQPAPSDPAALLANCSASFGATRAMGDLDGDGDVDLTDLAEMLIAFGASCP